MCKLITISKKSNQNDNLIKKIIVSQIDDIFLERDGIGSLTINSDTKAVSVDRSLTDYKGVMARFINAIPKSCILSLHSRTCTAGSKSEKNVHFFNKKHLYLAHNGVVSDWQSEHFSLGLNAKSESDYWKTYPDMYGDYDIPAFRPSYQQRLKTTYDKTLNDKLIEQHDKAKISDKSDTLKFLESLPLKINEHKLEEKMDKGFMGVATLIDTKQRKVFQFATREYHAYTDLTDFIITFSYKPDIETKTTLFGYSLPVENASETCKLVEVNQDMVSFNY